MADPLAVAIRQQVWTRYEKERPRPGNEYDAFCEALAAELSIEAKQVARIIARESNALQNQIRRHMLTQGQIIADQLGASVVEAIAVFHDALGAVKNKVVLDKSGRPVIDPGTNKPIVLENPDHVIRMQAAHRLIQVHAAYAPQQYEVKGEITHRHETMDETQLLDQLKALAPILNDANLLAALGNTRTIAGQSGLDSGQSQSDPGAEGRLLLADGMHGDTGRTGRGESVQAFPTQAVHIPATRSPRKRTYRFSRKEPDHDGVLDGGGVG